MTAYLTTLVAALLAGQPQTGPTAAAAPAAKPLLIRGKIVGPDGRPASDVFLSAARAAPAGQLMAEDGRQSVALCCARDGCGEKALATVRQDFGPETSFACAKADGSFEIEVAERGAYTLFVQPAGLLSRTLEVTVPGKDVRLALQPGFAVKGLAMNLNGQRVQWMGLTLEPAGEAAKKHDRRFLVRQRTTESDEAGNYRFQGLADGLYRICSKAVLPAKESERGRVQPCSEVEVRGADVAEKVVDAGAAPGILPTHGFGDHNPPGGPRQDPVLRQAQPLPRDE